MFCLYNLYKLKYTLCWNTNSAINIKRKYVKHCECEYKFNINISVKCLSNFKTNPSDIQVNLKDMFSVYIYIKFLLYISRDKYFPLNLILNKSNDPIIQ